MFVRPSGCQKLFVGRCVTRDAFAAAPEAELRVQVPTITDPRGIDFAVYRRLGQTPEMAARRELADEIGLAGYRLLPAGTDQGIWDGRMDRVHFFELRLEQLPELRLDNREIIGARLVPAAELRGMALTGPVIAYLGRTLPPSCQP